MDQNIDQHISKNQNELLDGNSNSQRRRYLESELESLIKYKQNHPDRITVPTPLELYCDENPHAPECRIYEV
jgi:hypothetical protein